MPREEAVQTRALGLSIFLLISLPNGFSPRPMGEHGPRRQNQSPGSFICAVSSSGRTEGRPMSDLRLQVVASLRPQDIDALSDEVVLALARRLGSLPLGDSAGGRVRQLARLRRRARAPGDEEGRALQTDQRADDPVHQDGPAASSGFCAPSSTSGG
jgi:hypothetical protein